MVIRKNIKSYVLISVYDKSNLKKLCSKFVQHKIDIISTGATSRVIRSHGFKCLEISNLTKFKEILDGRVKTLNSKIHASILFKRNDASHEKTFLKLNFPRIDYLVVNLYPFSKIPNKKNIDKKIDMIDIGGPSLIRSASKNFDYVTTISHKKYYNSLIMELDKNHGKTTLNFRKKMARENFRLTSKYDLSIFKWFNNQKEEIKNKKIKLKYGENPNQSSYFIANSKNNIFNSQVSGKKIGYNNILDISHGLDCLSDFKEPTCVIIKHNNPCGVASSNKIEEAYKKALFSDPTSSFGGVVLLNRSIDGKLAKIISNNFYEVIVSPKVKDKTKNILSKSKNLILIDSYRFMPDNMPLLKSVKSGILYQEQIKEKITSLKLKSITSKTVTKKTLDDLVFAFKVAKHAKSNAIVFAKNKQTLGIGAGQMSRLDSTRVAIMKYKDFFKGKNFVCASDAFFPFTDNIKLLKKYKCEAIVQPGGSINDNKIIDFAEKNKLPLYFVKNRVFKH
tara:strand:- start:10264 stop:11781 length:1518 start_codon:yes stop_codon:yes gene_type:complete